MRAFILSRYPWTIAAGLLLAASFPKIGIAGLAWVAPGLILLAALGQPGKSTFRTGYVAGLAHYLLSLGWLLRIPVPGKYAWAPVLGWLALGAFLALLTGTWVWLCWKTYPVRFTSVGRGTAYWNWSGIDQFMLAPWSVRMRWAVTGAMIWVSLEMLITRLLGGFPWNLLGDSQYQMTPLIQICSTTGVYGISFLIVWTSLSFLGAAAALIRKPFPRSSWVGEVVLPMLTIVVLYGVGYNKLMQPAAPPPEVSVALIQPSIPQTDLDDEAKSAAHFQDLLLLSALAMTNQPDLMIWPESAVPKMFRDDKETYAAITGFAREHKIWLLFNSDDYTPRPGATSWKDCDFYNAAFLINPQGEVAAEYRKQKLVAFGEFVPLSRTLPFLKFLTPITGSFTPGDRPVPFVMPDLPIKTAVLICFEDAFPQLARLSVDDDTDFLVNITNDGWFGEGAAQWQQAAMSVFRTVENAVPLLRCSNTGLTCWIDAGGRMRQVFRSASHGEYGPGYIIAKIPVLALGAKRPPTFYRAHGDWFGWGCVIGAALQILAAGARSRGFKQAS